LASQVVKKKELPFHYQFLAGGIAGVTEIVTMYPLDVVKTRFQLQVGKSAAEGAYTGVVDCFTKIVRNEGFATLYRGLIPPVVVESPRRAIKFAAYEQFSKFYRGVFKTDEVTRGISVLSGASGGCIEGALVVGFEIVKIRLQDKRNAGMYNGTMDAVKKIYHQEGLRAFVRGYEACAWRHGLWNVGYFGVIKTVRDMLPESQSKAGALLNAFVAGTIGGTAGTILNTPSDVAKTRIQSQLVGVRKYRWTIPAVATIYKEEGFAALFKGFVPKVLRLGPGGGILLVVFDAASNVIRKYML